MSVAERLKLLVDHEGSQVKFSQKTNLSYSVINKTILRGSGLTANSLENIALAYPTLNLRWLLTGEGPMWLEAPPADTSPSSRSELSHERMADLLEKRVRELEREIKRRDAGWAKELGIE